MAFTLTAGYAWADGDLVTATRLATVPTLASNQTYLFGDGLVGTPAVSFNSDSDTGLYWISANQFGLACAGVNIATINAAGITLNVAADGYFQSVSGAVTGFFQSYSTGSLVRIGSTTAHSVAMMVSTTEVARFTTTGMTLAAGTFLTLGAAYVAGAVVNTGSITIKDSTGTTYRVACLI